MSALWIVNVLLALAFVGAGLLKVVRSKEQLYAAGMTWTEGFSQVQIRLVGVAEVLGALGLVLPLLTGTALVLAPAAAVALTATMAGATTVHVRRGENPAPAVVLLVLCVVSAALGCLAVAASSAG